MRGSLQPPTQPAEFLSIKLRQTAGLLTAGADLSLHVRYSIRFHPLRLRAEQVDGFVAVDNWSVHVLILLKSALAFDLAGRFN